jgi:hypothetical protein
MDGAVGDQGAPIPCARQPCGILLTRTNCSLDYVGSECVARVGSVLNVVKVGLRGRTLRDLQRGAGHPLWSSPARRTSPKRLGPVEHLAEVIVIGSQSGIIALQLTPAPSGTCVQPLPHAE